MTNECFSCCIELLCTVCCRVLIECWVESCCKDYERKRTVTSSEAVPRSTNFGVQQPLIQHTACTPQQSCYQPQQYQPVQQPACATPLAQKAVPCNPNVNYGAQQPLMQQPNYTPQQSYYQPQQHQPVPCVVVQQPASAPPLDCFNGSQNTRPYVQPPPSYSEAVGLEQVKPKVEQKAQYV